MGRKKQSKSKLKKKQARWSKNISPRSVRNPERIAKAKKKPKKKQPRETRVSLTPVSEKYSNFEGVTRYTPQSVRSTFTGGTNREVISAMKKEYSRLRPTALKRLDRLSKSQFNKSNTYQYYKDRFKALSEINDSDIAKALAEINRFLASNQSTVSGQKKQLKQTISKLKSYNYEITDTTAPMIFDIMEYIRTEHAELLFDSNQVMELATDIVHDLKYRSDRKGDIHFSDFSVKELGEFVYELYEYDSGIEWNVPNL